MHIETTKNGAYFVRTGRYFAINYMVGGLERASERQIASGDFYVEAQMLPVSPQRFERIHVSNIKA